MQEEDKKNPHSHRILFSVKEKLEKLCELGVLSSDQMMIAMTEHKKTNEPIEKIIVYLGFISENTLTAIMSEETGVQRISLKNTVLDIAAVKKLPKFIAEKLVAIPIVERGSHIIVAMADVDDVRARDQIKRYFPEGNRIVPFLSSRTDIINAINNYYDFNMSPELILQEIEDNAIEKKHEQESFSSPIVRFLDAIILDAVKKRGSDIHFQPEKFFVRIRYRIDGILHQICTFHKNYWPQLCVRVKIVANMNISDSIRPQNGRFSLAVLGREVDFRVSSHPISNGENIVIRILDKTYSLISLDKLGYSPHNMAMIHRSIFKKDGMIIVTGPTGAGKTTSLYSMLSMIQSDKVNIMTLEDPIEYELPLIRQSSVQDIPGRGFADGLRSILRQDPDIIFVGEIRDHITAEMALRGAMTGHQVFTTLHTQDSFGALFRLIDLGISPTLLAGNILCVIAQRLVRKLCNKCKIKRHATKEEMDLLKVDYVQQYDAESVYDDVRYAAEESEEYDESGKMQNIVNIDKLSNNVNKIMSINFANAKNSINAKRSHERHTVPIEIYIENGCDECNKTGYNGRTSIAEILEFSEEINELIYSKKSLLDIKKIAYKNGFISLKDDARNRIIEGETTIAEVLRIVDL